VLFISGYSADAFRQRGNAIPAIRNRPRRLSGEPRRRSR
jgi:hypothetical protein